MIRLHHLLITRSITSPEYERRFMEILRRYEEKMTANLYYSLNENCITDIRGTDDRLNELISKLEKLKVKLEVGEIPDRYYINSMIEIEHEISKLRSIPVCLRIRLMSLEKLIEVIRLLNEESEFNHIRREAFNTLVKYLESVEDVINSLQDKASAAVALLYPFLSNVVQIQTGQVDESLNLKKEITHEQEILMDLRRVNADAKVVERHLKRHRDLEQKLQNYEREVAMISLDKDLMSSIETIGRMFDPIHTRVSFHFLRWLGKIPSPSEPMSYDADRVVKLLTFLFMKYIYPSLMKDGKIILNLHTNEKQTTAENYVAKAEASLTWLNEECHVMQDSILESDGKELELCPNRKSLIVYHNCLNILRSSPSPYCLVCGTRITYDLAVTHNLNTIITTPLAYAGR